MGIQINGNTNNINAGIGSLSIEDLNELDIVGVATAANFKTGVSNLHNVGLTLSGGQIDVGSNIKIGNSGIVTAQQVRYSAGGALYNGHPRSVVIGYSGSNYANLGMGWVPTSTNDVYTSANSDYQSRLELYDGLQIYGSGVSVTSGQNVTWKNVADFKPSAIKLYTSGDSNAEKLRITSTGQVNIGGNYTDTGNLLGLDTNYEGFPSDSSQPEAILLIRGRGTNNRFVGIGASNTGSWIQASGPGHSGPTSNFCINPVGGKIGINNNSPNTQLQVTAQTVNATTISTTNSKQLGLWIQSTGGSNTTGHIENGIAFAEGYAGLYSIDAGSGATSDLAFFTGAAAGVAERLRIFNTNTLGIARFTSPASGDTLNLQTDAGGGQGMIFGTDISNTHIYLKNNSSGTFGFQYKHGSTTQLQVASNGYMGLGMGSEAPSTMLHVRNTHSTAYANDAASSGSNGIVVQNTNGHVSGGAYTGIQFNISGNSQNRVGAIGFISEDTSNRHGTLVFHTDDTGSRSEAMRIESTGRNMIVCNKNNVNNTYYPKRQHRRSITASSAGSDWFRVAYLPARSKFRVHCSTTGGYYAPGTKSFTCLRNWDNTTFYLGEIDGLGSNWVTAARMQANSGGSFWYLEVYFNNVNANQLGGFMTVVVEPQSGSAMTNTIELNSYGQNMSNLTYTSSQYNI